MPPTDTARGESGNALDYFTAETPEAVPQARGARGGAGTATPRAAAPRAAAPQRRAPPAAAPAAAAREEFSPRIQLEVDPRLDALHPLDDGMSGGWRPPARARLSVVLTVLALAQALALGVMLWMMLRPSTQSQADGSRVLGERPVASNETAPGDRLPLPEVAGERPPAKEPGVGATTGTTSIDVPVAAAPAPRPRAPAVRDRAASTAAKAPAIVGVPLVSEAVGNQPPGRLRLAAPVELQVLENGRVIGSSADESIVASAGWHEYEFVNAAFDFRVRLRVEIRANETVTVPVSVPTATGQVSVNATPWAQVWIDGQPVGETPLANLPLSAGVHEVVFRHPQLGERTEKIVVRASTLTRVSVAMGR